MTDDAVHTRIDALIAEEHALRDRLGAGGTGEGERSRLRELETQLDQAWDLLRQRRARREFGEDPDGAEARSANTVENYRN
ncbi:hypothetical protein AXK56_13550 [Tsukamurella pulmonis]|uniref:DUF2630 domain-containing protein n=1 Tax=Tsukamurella pulmonis TaxID=47312 RepID=A0A1H1GMV1_9ACTN|nr:DUF2630 family protein [Tsukamurella pulmonis]KXO88355.1 hypothetical protein AXK56_13550 [Tsukamurella pulmonis]SDR14461.1 Protein of unknown function [Tsukamurella pulmonis]SUP17004.1 Protein of uncharacterised function (DUF2630) [Tsukamurella pulmonis]